MTKIKKTGLILAIALAQSVSHGELMLADDQSAPPSDAPISIGRMVIDENGTQNPMEFKLEAMPFQEVSTYVCYTGYITTKSASHEAALIIHQKCADAGYTGSMLWLSYIYQNGYNVEKSPELSAYWDMRAAEAGNEVGMYNYGLDILRGYGVGLYVVAGQYWINRAADLGHKHAIELRQANYDLRVATPDTDEAGFKNAS